MTARRTVIATLAKIPQEYHACLGATARGRRHDFDDHNPAPGEYKGPDWGKTFASRCVDCATRKFVTIDSLGNVSCTPRYIRTPEYKRALRIVADAGLTQADMRVDHLAAYKAKMRSENTQRQARKLRAV